LAKRFVQGDQMNADEGLAWFMTTFGVATPSQRDFYQVATDQYNAQRYQTAVRCLKVGFKNSLEAPKVPALHLLAHCHMKLCQYGKAMQCFKGCIRLGYEEDWQNVVELLYLLDNAKILATRQQQINQKLQDKLKVKKQQDAKAKRRAAWAQISSMSTYVSEEDEDEGGEEAKTKDTAVANGFGDDSKWDSATSSKGDLELADADHNQFSNIHAMTQTLIQEHGAGANKTSAEEIEVLTSRGDPEETRPERGFLN